MSKNLKITQIEYKEDKILYHFLANDFEYITGLDLRGVINPQALSHDPAFRRLVEYCSIMYATYMYSIDFFDEVELFFALDAAEKVFFEKTFLLGLAEHKYVNNIPVSRSVNIFSATDDSISHFEPSLEPRREALVLNGGGKDGVVGMAIVEALGIDATYFSLNENIARDDIAKVSRQHASIVVPRVVDTNLKAHTIHPGHKPMSAYLACVTTMLAYAMGTKYIVASNEHSSNFANFVSDGIHVNHQYSKSYEFENDFHTLLVKKGFKQHYFSILRPLHELNILKIFTNFEAYHQVFRSCNDEVATNTWCMKCSKCAFVVAGFYALDARAAEEIWGNPHEVLNEPRLQKAIVELINPHQKPFECIGTTEESTWVIQRLLEQGLLVIRDEELNATLKSYFEQAHSTDVIFDFNAASTSDEPTGFPEELAEGIHSAIARLMNGEIA